MNKPRDKALSVDTSAAESLTPLDMDRDPPFDIQDYKIALSQQAFLHFQQIQQQAARQVPNRQWQFANLLEQAVHMNQDPAILKNTVLSWLPIHP